jgi:short-chain fatty acids transporter
MSITNQENKLVHFAVQCANWAEKWFPDSWVFAASGLAVISTALFLIGVPPMQIANAFGNGFWTLIPFTMQMAFVVIGGYVVASSPPVIKLIQRIACIPNNGRSAIAMIAFLSMSASLINWGLSIVFCGLLVKSLAARKDLRMDYRAAAAAGYLGLGAVWALGLSSSAAQLEANPASLPPSILAITGVIPFTQTIFLWQSGVLLITLMVASIIVAYISAPSEYSAKTAEDCGVEVATPEIRPIERNRPGEFLEQSPLLVIILSLLASAWLFSEFSSKPFINVISNLNTYNFFFIMLGLLLHWRPASFLHAVSKAVPTTAGVLIQFPLYGSMAALMTQVQGVNGLSLSAYISEFFVAFATRETYPIVIGIYSAVLGFFIPSGGGKWIIEAPYVMQVAKDLQYHLGWSVQIYNAAEALPNLINPFYMLPLLGILGIKARDIIGFSFVQFLIHFPLVLFLLWILGNTLSYIPPITH